MQVRDIARALRLASEEAFSQAYSRREPPERGAAGAYAADT